jgi:hypothetical protein
MDKHKRKPFSNKVRDTHLHLTPHINKRGLREITYCSCAQHPGFLRFPPSMSKHHCNSRCCESHLALELPSSHVYDFSFLEEQWKKEKARKINSPTYRFHPKMDEEGKRYVWVLDRGNHVYILKPKKEEIIEEIERDHIKLYLENP